MLTKVFTPYTKVLRNYLEFHDTYTRAFENFLSALEALANARLTHQIIDQVTLERYLWAIAYDLQKISTNFELVFIHIHIAIMLNHWSHSLILKTSCYFRY